MSRLAVLPDDVAPAPARGPAPDARAGVTVGLAGLAALLAVLTVTVGLGRAAWAVGLGSALLLATLVVRGLAGDGRLRWARPTWSR